MIITIPDEAIGHDVILGQPLFQTNAKLTVSPQSVTTTQANTIWQLMRI